MKPMRLRHKSLYLALSLIGALGSYAIVSALMPAPEIALTLGEPWEQMRQRSTARIGDAIPKVAWFSMPKTDASLRFIDSEYGFTTPAASFLAVGYLKRNVENVHISPQIEPLLIDDALDVLLGIQNQLIAKGWENIRPKSSPSFADTPEWRAKLRDSKTSVITYWQAGDKYQVFMSMGRFTYSKRPDEERYLIRIELNSPWIPKVEDENYIPSQPTPAEHCKLQCK